MRDKKLGTAMIGRPPVETKMEVTEARRILGRCAEKLTDKEIKVYMARFQQLAEWVLDEFERKQFGKTIREME